MKDDCSHFEARKLINLEEFSTIIKVKMEGTSSAATRVLGA